MLPSADIDYTHMAGLGGLRHPRPVRLENQSEPPLCAALTIGRTHDETETGLHYCKIPGALSMPGRR